MGKSKSSISKAESYHGIGAYWDTHDLPEHWNEGKDVHFEVDIRTEQTYCILERDLSERVREIAQKHGVSSDTLVNMWLQDRIIKEKGKSTSPQPKRTYTRKRTLHHQPRSKIKKTARGRTLPV
jgi:hypothetical protein